MMPPDCAAARPRVAIVGGGLAGLAAAAALAGSPLQVELFESRRQLGGRATSFQDETTGECVDHCQHVGMGCCTALIDFSRRIGVEQLFRRVDTLHFIGPAGEHWRVTATRGLPPPLHLLPALLRIPYLNWRERLQAARGLMELAACRAPDLPGSLSMSQWLASRRQTAAVISRFWSVVLVSALSESLPRISVAAARQVFVTGFLRRRDGYQLLIPQLPLRELFDKRAAQWLHQHKVTLHRQAPVASIRFPCDASARVRLENGCEKLFDYVVLAVPWQRLPRLLAPDTLTQLEARHPMSRLESAPITAVHLWLAQPLFVETHAVLVERLAQWVFHQGEVRLPDGRQAHHYQIVISASRELLGRPQPSVLEQLLSELAAIWPAAQAQNLLHWRLVTERHAVFSPQPGSSQLRPPQRTPLAACVLAGDWTRTGWPATMEGAIRSGYAAAEVIRKRERL